MTTNIEYHKNDQKDIAIAGAEGFESGSWWGFVLSINKSSRKSEATSPRN